MGEEDDGKCEKEEANLVIESKSAKSMYHLPNDIIELLLKRLPLDHHFRVGAVCKAWKLAEVATPKPPQLFLPGTSSHPFPTLLSLDDKGMQKLNVSHCKGYSVGSFKGWLLMRESHSGLFLLNAFSGQRIWLPPMLKPVKGILSASPTLDDIDGDRCVVACILGQQLGLCRPTDEKWTFFSNLKENSNDYYREIVFLNGKLYAIRRSLVLEVWDIDEPNPVVTTLSVAPPRCEGIKEGNYIRNLYLVDSLTGLLMVVGSSYELSPEFWVFKLVNENWYEVESLDNQIMLVGQYGSKLLPASSIAFYTGNCIYYTAHIYRDWFCGIFSMKDRSVERIKLNSVSQPTWITWHPFDFGVPIQSANNPFLMRLQKVESGGESIVAMWVHNGELETCASVFMKKDQSPSKWVELHRLRPS